MCNEVPCACDGLRDGCLAVGKVDPLQILDDLIVTGNIKVEARHDQKQPDPEKVAST
jgi:hypothetical protein